MKNRVTGVEKKPLLAVDAVIFTIINKKLHVLLIQIAKGVYAEKWAVPGCLVKYEESLDQAIKRLLAEKTNIRNLYLEQVYTFGDPNRDKRGRSVSVAYFGLINKPENLNFKTLEYYKDIKWFEINKLPNLAFDHEKIIKTAYERVKSKLSYTNIAYTLLPKEFTLGEVQNIYEIIYGKKLDKRNFRKSILTRNIVVESGNVQDDVFHRPAKLYKFTKRTLEFI